MSAENVIRLRTQVKSFCGIKKFREENFILIVCVCMCLCVSARMCACEYIKFNQFNSQGC